MERKEIDGVAHWVYSTVYNSNRELQYTKGGGLGRLFDDNDDGPRGADDDDDGKNCEEGGSKVWKFKGENI